jgi:phosphate transport system substrate-binding protein
MSPKPLRNGTSGWLGRRTARLKSLAVVGTVTLGMAGIGIAAAGPAAADPATTYVAVGSDTIQDVMNGFADGVSGGIIGSYNAVNPVTATAHEIITPAKALAGGTQSNCSFTRPNGSTEGFNALDISMGGTATGLASPPGAGCVDIARSSGAPGSVSSTAGAPGSLNVAGPLVYVPFGVDAVTGATAPTTAGQTTTITTPTGPQTVTVAVTTITQANLFTKTDLTNLYAGMTATEGGVTYWPLGSTVVTQPPGSTVIDLYAPQAGSGTLKFWAAQLGFSATAPPAWVHQTIQAGPAATEPVEEHDGSVYASDPAAYGPFSIAQWVAQSNGKDDRRHTAILNSINGVAPTVAGPALNPAFPILREVYNVVSFAAVTGGDAVLQGLLSGTGSRLCTSTFTIKSFGFGTLPNAALPDACGATPNANRVNL